MQKETYPLQKEDPVYPLCNELLHRKELSPLERAAKTYKLLVMLHKTQTPSRPLLNGNSRDFITKNLKISKSLLSQYLSIHKNITSPIVKEEMQRTALAVRFSYLVSSIRGKNTTETEILQLVKIQEFTKDRRTTKYHKSRGVIQKIS